MNRRVHRLVLPLLFPAGVAPGDGGDYNRLTIARNGLAQPVLRGTALAGALRHAYGQYLKRQGADDADGRVQRFFGYVPPNEQAGGTRSRLQVSDSILDTGNGLTLTRTHHVRNRHTGTVADAGLFTLEICPPGTRATVALWLQDDAEEPDDAEQCLAALIACLQHGVTLGGNAARGIGLATLEEGVRYWRYELDQVADHAAWLDEHRAWRQNPALLPERHRKSFLEAPPFRAGRKERLSRIGSTPAVAASGIQTLEIRNKYAKIMSMELTLQLKLLPTADQAIALRAVMTRFNEACNWLAAQACAKQCTNKLTLQRLYYHQLRTRFDLPSQMVVRCLARVAGAYRRNKALCPAFRPDAALPYDQRLMRFDGLDHVSLATGQGRMLVSFLIGPYHRQRFDAHAPRQCHLMCREDGQWFLLVVVQVPDGTPMPPTDFLGVDLGVATLAMTSDGIAYSGDKIEACRARYLQYRRRLQRAATVAQLDGNRPKNIRRALKRTSRKEARFRQDTNHCISKKLVAAATGNGEGIALEALTHIRTRTRFRKPQRARMTGWAFAQLRCFVEYKARLTGVVVVLVDPRHTSRGCSQCGHIAQANRPQQAHFSCKACGYTTNADFNAALNIRSRARVRWPIVAVRPPQQRWLLAGEASDKLRPSGRST